MKRAICIILVVLFCCGCTSKKDTTKTKSIEKTVGVWISYNEIYSLIDTGDFKGEFGKAVNNLKHLGITDAFVHIRPFCDSFYESAYFPINEKAKPLDFDIVEYMINSLHKENIKFHAWINPYRVKTSDNDPLTLDTNSPAYRWLNDEYADNDTNVSVIVGGIYLNPASCEVNKLIIDGVKEIISKYDVDGIHFDDYFYPTASEDFDKSLYEKYKSECENPMCLEDWRRSNVSSLISGVYSAIKFNNRDIIFSISPTASIEKNYNEYFADISLWCENSLIDIIIPQLYFGFNYPDKNYRFNNLIKDWKNLVKGKNVPLYIGLATYKIGTNIEYEYEEWQSGDCVIEKETAICNEDEDINGIVFFSYSSLFSNETLNTSARKKIKAVINR